MLTSFILFFGGIILSFLVVRQWREFRVKKLMKECSELPFPEEYERILLKFKSYSTFNFEEKKNFQTKILYFLRDKNFNGVGLEVTEEMKILVAAEACLLILNLDGGVYPGLKNIYIMEDAFIPKENPVNPSTGLPTHSPRLGEAWKRGPIVLSWNAILQGSGVVFHEFSHHLDQEDGSFDGTPKLGVNGNYEKWARVMGKAYLKLRHQVINQKRSDIDAYGATNEAEFFAVVTEYFFTNPHLLKENHPDIFEIYRSYFKLDPRRWN